jgi:signal transduction histidine kinase
MAVADLTLEGLVHDLNNVFQTIGESAELLGEDPKWQKLAHTLQRSVDRGQRIVHSILDTNRSTTDLAPVLEHAIQFCRDYLECANGPKIEFVAEIDSGFRPGISPELLPRIFDPRVSTKSIISGLGLYVVQSIVEQNGGSVTAANGPNGGAVFTMQV